MVSRFRQLPGVDTILADSRIETLKSNVPHSVIVTTIRDVLEKARDTIASGGVSPTPELIVSEIIARVNDLLRPSLHG
jgi:hypothetical protein